MKWKRAAYVHTAKLIPQGDLPYLYCLLGTVPSLFGTPSQAKVFSGKVLVGTGQYISQVHAELNVWSCVSAVALCIVLEKVVKCQVLKQSLAYILASVKEKLHTALIVLRVFFFDGYISVQYHILVLKEILILIQKEGIPGIYFLLIVS